MLLQPSKFIFNTSQNKRTSKFPTSPELVYGSQGLVIINPYSISANNVFRLNLFLNNSSNNSTRTSSRFWLSAFPHLPLSSNPNGMRMGNGAGKLSSWYTQIRGGVVLVEFKNLSYGRSRYFINQVSHKLPVPTTFNESTSRNIYLPGARRTNPHLTSF